MVSYAVEHDAGAVNVVVSGPLFVRLKPEREVAVGMMFTCKDFKTENQQGTFHNLSVCQDCPT